MTYTWLSIYFRKPEGTGDRYLFSDINFLDTSLKLHEINLILKVYIENYRRDFCFILNVLIVNTRNLMY